MGVSGKKRLEQPKDKNVLQTPVSIDEYNKCMTFLLHYVTTLKFVSEQVNVLFPANLCVYSVPQLRFSLAGFMNLLP